MAETVIGALSVVITADTKGVQDGLKATGKALKLSGDKLRKNVNDWGKWAIAATAAATGVAAAIVKSNLSAIKELENTAKAADTQVAAFQRGAFAANSVGISTEKYGDILKDVNDRVGDFLISGAGPMVDFFETIGPKVNITAEAFKGLSGQQSLGLYIKSLQDAGVSQQEMTFFMEALASDSIALAPLFQNNAKAFNALTKEAKSLGIGLSDIDVAKAALASGELAKVSGIIDSISKQVTVELAPIIGAVADLFVDMAKEAGGSSQFIQNAIDKLVTVVGVFANGLRGIEIIFKGLEVAALGFTSLAAVAFSGLAELTESIGNQFKEIGKTQGALGGQFRALGFIFGQTKDEIDGVTKSTSDLAKEIAESQLEALADRIEALKNLALEPLPSDEIKAFVSEAVGEYERLATAKAKALGADELGDEGVGTKTTSQIELVEAETIGLLEALSLRFLSQEEMQLGHLDREREMLSAARANGEITAIQHSEKLAEIKQQEEDIKRTITLNAIQQGFQALAIGSKKVRKLMAAAATSQAIIKGKQAAVDAWQAGMSTGGPWAPFVAAAYAAASIINTTSMIKSINSSGSGGAPKPSANISAPGGGFNSGGVGSQGAGQQQQQPARVVSVSFVGSAAITAMVRDEIIPALNEAIGDGVTIDFPGG